MQQQAELACKQAKQARTREEGSARGQNEMFNELMYL